jgi:hypothetical protein
MNMDLIASTLGLPPGAWPPDHYTLLGLPVGIADTAEVELRVLDRMERLRRYQLTHPESITDAMNRLAQAMVCLTDLDAKRAYDATLSVRPADQRPAVAPPEPPATVPGRAPAVARPAPAALPTPLAVLPPEPTPVPTGLLANDLLLPHVPRPDDRRALYRQLVRARRLLWAWDRVGKYLAEPDRRLVRRSDAVELVRQLQVIRDSIDEATPLGELVGEPGALVLALSRQPLFTQTFRSLLSGQRAALADDWRAGRAAVAANRRVLRWRLRARRRRPSLRTFGTGRSLVADHPDVMLLLLGLSALLLAIYRGWHLP